MNIEDMIQVHNIDIVAQPLYFKCALSFLRIIYYIDKIQVLVGKNIVAKVDAKLIAIWRLFDKL